MAKKRFVDSKRFSEILVFNSDKRKQSFLRWGYNKKNFK